MSASIRGLGTFDPGTGPLIVLCATMPWRGTTMLDQHVARALTAYGSVLYVDRPTSFLTRWRNPSAAAAANGPWMEEVEDRLFVVRPRVNPLMERPVGKWLSVLLTRATMRRAVRALGGVAVHAVIVPSLNRYFGALDELYKVYYASDDHLGGAALMDVSVRLLRGETERQVGAADVVVAVSPPLAEKLGRTGTRVLMIPNGVDTEHFAQTESARPSADILDALAKRCPGRTSVVGVVGHLGNRLDMKMLQAVAGRGHAVLLVGPRHRTADASTMDRLLATDGVCWVGPSPYEDLPSVLAVADTWLLPYADDDFNRASFPLKILEYLAAGRRVVATALPAVAWLDTPLILTAADAEQFADQVDAATAVATTVQERASRMDFAANHTWADRVQVLASELGLSRASGDRPERSAVDPAPLRLAALDKGN